VGWLSLMALLLGPSTGSPAPSSPEPAACLWIAGGDTVHVTRQTVMYVFPSCPGGVMTRERLIESMGCEDRRKSLRLQAQRLRARLAVQGIEVLCGPADVRVGAETEEGALNSVSLVENTQEFFGTVLLAPRRPPARLLGQNTDDEFMALMAEYFR
jgi:hypothetical protein